MWAKLGILVLLVACGPGKNYEAQQYENSQQHGSLDHEAQAVLASPSGMSARNRQQENEVYTRKLELKQERDSLQRELEAIERAQTQGSSQEGKPATSQTDPAGATPTSGSQAQAPREASRQTPEMMPSHKVTQSSPAPSAPHITSVFSPAPPMSAHQPPLVRSSTTTSTTVIPRDPVAARGGPTRAAQIRARIQEIDEEVATVLNPEEIAIQQSIKYETSGLTGYQKVRVRLYPIENTDGIYFSTRASERTGFKVEGAAPFKIQVVDIVNSKVIAEIGQSKTVEVKLKAIESGTSKENVLIGDGVSYTLSDLFTAASDKFLAIRLVPTSETSLVTIGTRRLNQREYRGNFLIFFDKKRWAKEVKAKEKTEKQWSLINHVSMETYLRSVVPGEISASQPFEVLKTQAIAARTYTVQKMREARMVRNVFWDVDPTTRFHTYQGISIEHERTDQAVAETANQVIINQGRVALTEYHGCSIGNTKEDKNNPVSKVRNNPDSITCGAYFTKKGSFVGGHGRGLCQNCAMDLGSKGWTGDNSPTERAKFPQTVDKPWNHRDILKYYYNQSDIQNLTPELT